MLAALAGALMSLEFSIPMMPVFYKIDFADVPAIIAIFLMGPLSGVCVEVIKVLIKLITVGTNTMYVGEFANLIGIIIFVLPIWFIYKKGNYSKKAAGISLIASIPLRIAVSCCINAFITLPMYAAAMGVGIDDVVMMVSKANPAIKDLTTFIILATIPFNLIKNALNNFIGWLLYDRLLKISFIAEMRNFTSK